jgi:hypothetical protein
MHFPHIMHTQFEMQSMRLLLIKLPVINEFIVHNYCVRKIKYSDDNFFTDIFACENHSQINYCLEYRPSILFFLRSNYVQ